MLEATAQLLVHGRRAGWWRAARLNGGHQQAPGASTACPGRNSMAVIGSINARAAAIEAGAPALTEDDMPLTADDIERVAIRTRDHLATGANPWGLDALLTRLIRIETLTIAADVNDSPDVLAGKLAETLAPLLVPAIADAVEAGGIGDRAQLESAVEDGLRRVLGSLG
jgi:hypothetical protein